MISTCTPQLRGASVHVLPSSQQMLPSRLRCFYLLTLVYPRSRFCGCACMHLCVCVRARSARRNGDGQLDWDEFQEMVEEYVRLCACAAPPPMDRGGRRPHFTAATPR